MWISRTVSAVLVATSLIVACGSDDDASGPTVLDPGSDVAGSGTAELLAVYFGALAEVPLEESIYTDLANCDMGRSTDEVYLAPTWTSPGESSTSCTMNADQALVLVPAGALCVETDEDVADTACLDDQYNLTSSSTSINDVEVTDLESREVDTEVFTTDLPEGNIFEADPGSFNTIARGQVVVVEDLPVGSHTVVVAADFGDGEFAGSLTIDLTVEE